MSVRKSKKMRHWDVVALEAEEEPLPVRKAEQRRIVRNWLAYYAEYKARDLIARTVENQVKLKGDARVLDIGCGPGKWVNFFAQRGFRTTGIDSSPWMIALAKKKVKNNLNNLIEFYVMNAAGLNLPFNSYDMVNCVTVLQHIFDDKEWRNAVHEIVRVAKPLSYVLIFEAAPSFVFKKQTRHLRFRAMKDYIREFGKAGAHLTYWRATDLSFPITFWGLRKYAASFSEEVYYYRTDELTSFSTNFLSFLSRMAVALAKPVDYRLAETPLGFLSICKLLLFRKVRAMR